MELTCNSMLTVINFAEQFNPIINIVKLQSIRSRLKDMFTKENLDIGSNIFVLDNEAPILKCMIMPNLVSIESAGVLSLEEFKAKVMKIIDTLRDMDIINNITRVGFRTVHIKNYKEESEACNTIVKNFHLNNSGTRKITNDITKPRLSFSCSKNGYNLNLTYSVAIQNHINVVDGVVKEQMTSFGTVADIDVAVEQDCKFSKIFEYYNSFYDLTLENLKISKELI